MSSNVKKSHTSPVYDGKALGGEWELTGDQIGEKLEEKKKKKYTV